MENARVWKDQLYGHFARVGKALASPRRLELLDLLSQGPKSVETLAHEISATVANVSQHLQILTQAHLVISHKSGTFVIYRLSSSEVVTLLEEVHSVTENLFSDVRALRAMYLTQRDTLAPVSAEELHTLVDAGNLYLIDVRPASEYEAGHLPGAISVPLPEVDSHFFEWSDSRPIVAYCRGRYCLYAREAVEILSRQGLIARRTEISVQDWVKSGQAG